MVAVVLVVTVQYSTLRLDLTYKMTTNVLRFIDVNIHASARIIWNNAKQSRQINPVRARHSSSCTLLFDLAICHAKMILYIYYIFNLCFGKFGENYLFTFHVQLFVLRFCCCAYLVGGDFNVASFPEENSILFLIYQSKAQITWDSLCMLCASIMEITLWIYMYYIQKNT